MNRRPVLPVLLAVALTTSAAAADKPSADLPPTRKLIEKAEQVCRRGMKEDPRVGLFALQEISRAWARIGEYDQAHMTAELLPVQLRGHVHHDCWKIRFEQTGMVGEPMAGIPHETALDKVNYQVVARLTAVVLGKAGRHAELNEILPKVVRTAQDVSFRNHYHIEMARHHVDRGEQSTAAKHLEVIWSLQKRLKPNWIVTGPRLQKLTPLWIDAGRRDRARESADLAQQLLQEWAAEKKPAHHIARDWAEVGRLQSMCEQPDQAREAFRAALQVVSEVESASKDLSGFSAVSAAQDSAGALGQIAAFQFAADQRKESAGTLDLALSKARSLDKDSSRDQALLRVLEHLCESGDLASGLKIVDSLETTSAKVRGYCYISTAKSAIASPDRGDELLREAEALAADKQDISQWILIARTYDARRDRESAHRCLQEAAQSVPLAERDNPLKFVEFNLQSVARAQIELGFLDDAWGTIQQSMDERWSLEPLAELADAAAKRDAAKGENRK